MFDKIVKTENKKSLARDERGLSTVEYIIILVLIAVAGITLWNDFGKAVKDKVSKSTTDISNLGQGE